MDIFSKYKYMHFTVVYLSPILKARMYAGCVTLYSPVLSKKKIFEKNKESVSLYYLHTL